MVSEMGRLSSEELAKLTATEYEYNTLMRLLGVSVSKHLLDEHFTVVWANDFFYDFIGLSREEYVTRYNNRPDVYYAQNDPQEWPRLIEAVTDALTEGRNGYEIIGRLKRKNGDFLNVKYTANFSDEYIDGKQVAYTVMTNIDDVIKMQREQSVTYDNLPGFVAKFRIEDGAPKFIEANGRFCDFFGYNGQAELTYGLTNLKTKRNVETYNHNLPLMQQGKSVHFTLQARNKSDGNMWLQVNADCIEWINDIPVYLVVYIDITDITEQRELQKQLEERTNMLQQANKAKSEFLSRMSHDIRTPMNAIMGMTDIAASHIDNRERVEDCLEKIKVSSRLLLSLINEVLDMSKIESGRITMEEKCFNFNDILQSIVTIMQPSILEKNHAFNIHAYDLQHEMVIGDPNRIQQVFLNILSNAVKYTPDNGNLSLDMRELPSEKAGYGRYEFTFGDDGYGMKPDFLEKIFTPFERANDAAIYSIQGTGLGMSISQNIVRMMDGDIKVESDYGKGSVFTVTIYLKLQNETSDFTIDSQLPVLVVDDDPIVCETTCERLRELGLQSEWADNGEDAVKKIASAYKDGQGYLAVIVDLKMSGMDGIQTSRRIRSEISKDLPIILLSSYDWTKYETEAVEAGIDGFIVKPMLKSALVAAIKQYVMKEDAPAKAHDYASKNESYADKRLLLVEDNELNREIAIELIGGTGIAIDSAVDGLDALEKFTSVPSGYYDLIFMDIQMPNMGGIEATRKIRKMSREDARTIPIIAMTANVLAEDVKEVTAAGMNDHVAKPFDIKLIEQVMERYIG